MTESKKSRAIFHRAIEEYVAPRLSELGFRRDKRSFFFKWNGDCFWRIWPFLRESRGIDEGFLHITVCVGFRDLTELFASWENARRDLDAAQPCNMAADIIYLRPVIQNPSRVTPDTDPDRLGICIWQDTKTFVIPFLEQVGTFEKAVESWKKGKFYNAAGLGIYLLAAAYFLQGEKSKALEVVRMKMAEEQAQIKAGPGPLGTLNSAEMDLVSRLNLRFDTLGTQNLARLKSFEAFLLKLDAPARPPR